MNRCSKKANKTFCLIQNTFRKRKTGRKCEKSNPHIPSQLSSVSFPRDATSHTYCQGPCSPSSALPHSEGQGQLSMRSQMKNADEANISRSLFHCLFLFTCCDDVLLCFCVF